MTDKPKPQPPLQFSITIGLYDEGKLAYESTHELLWEDGKSLRDLLGAQTFRSIQRTDSAVACHRLYAMLDGLIKEADSEEKFQEG